MGGVIRGGSCGLPALVWFKFAHIGIRIVWGVREGRQGEAESESEDSEFPNHTHPQEGPGGRCDSEFPESPLPPGGSRWEV